METKYVNYYRVSTKKQGKSGLGLSAQKEMVKPLTNQGTVVAEFTEVESGSKSNRKELLSAIELCKKENAILLVAKLDRLSRNVHFISTLMESKVQFKCADAPEMDNFTIHIFAAMAERERKMISERTIAGLSSIKNMIKKQGYYISKSGNKITSLGLSKTFTNEDEEKKYYREKALCRTYEKKSDVAVVLVKSLSKNGKKPTEIKKELEGLNINLAIGTIYNYLK